MTVEQNHSAPARSQADTMPRTIAFAVGGALVVLVGGGLALAYLRSPALIIDLANSIAAYCF